MPAAVGHVVFSTELVTIGAFRCPRATVVRENVVVAEPVLLSAGTPDRSGRV
jgi:hypothetical protein